MKQVCYICGAEMPCIAMIEGEPVAWVCPKHGVLQDGRKWRDARYSNVKQVGEANGK